MTNQEIEILEVQIVEAIDQARNAVDKITNQLEGLLVKLQGLKAQTSPRQCYVPKDFKINEDVLRLVSGETVRITKTMRNLADLDRWIIIKVLMKQDDGTVTFVYHHGPDTIHHSWKIEPEIFGCVEPMRNYAVCRQSDNKSSRWLASLECGDDTHCKTISAKIRDAQQ